MFSELLVHILTTGVAGWLSCSSCVQPATGAPVLHLPTTNPPQNPSQAETTSPQLSASSQLTTASLPQNTSQPSNLASQWATSRHLTSSASPPVAGGLVSPHPCYPPISTSPAWFNSSGPWSHPCSSGPLSPDSNPELSGVDASLLLELFATQPSASSLARDARIGMLEGADLADSLKRQIVENNMLNSVAQAHSWENATLIPGAHVQWTPGNSSQAVREAHRQVSVAAVYLEQSHHDDVILCTRHSNVVSHFQRLEHKLRQVLCSTQQVLGSLDVTASSPPVLRSVMPAYLRVLVDDAEGSAFNKRNYRDYVIAGDVKAMLRNWAAVFAAVDWPAA